MKQTQTKTESELSQWMKRVRQIAIEGVDRGEYPFGAGVFSIQGRELAISCNTVVSTNNPTAHAEINAIAAACQVLGTANLEEHWLITTAEPCPMCMAAIAMAGIRLVAFGAIQAVVTEAGYGSLGMSGSELASQFNHRIFIHGCIQGNECVSLLLKNRKG